MKSSIEVTEITFIITLQLIQQISCIYKNKYLLVFVLQISVKDGYKTQKNQISLRTVRRKITDIEKDVFERIRITIHLHWIYIRRLKVRNVQKTPHDVINIDNVQILSNHVTRFDGRADGHENWSHWGFMGRESVTTTNFRNSNWYKLVEIRKILIYN